MSKELEEHAELKTKVEAAKQELLAEFSLFAELKAVEDHAILRTKLADAQVAKMGKVLCGAPKGKDRDPCTHPGHLTSNLFCGTHKAHATSVAFTAILQCLETTSVTTLIASFGPSREVKHHAVKKLDKLAEKKKHEMNESELRRNDLEKKLKALEEKEKAQRQVVKQLRGPRVTKLYDILEEEIGVRFSHRSGEFGMTGNECRKFLRHYEDALQVVEDKHELYDKYHGLFEKFSHIVGLLYRTSPFSTLGFYPGEEDILQQKIPALPLQLPVFEGPIEVDEIANKFRELQTFYVHNFPNHPTPKQHMLAFHGPAFVQTWLSLGMFSEQAVESVHAMFNRSKKRYRNLGKEGAEHKAIYHLNLMYMSNRMSFKNKRRVGKRRYRVRGRLRMTSKK